VGPITGLDAVVKRNILTPCRDSNPAIIQPVAQRYEQRFWAKTHGDEIDAVCLSFRPSPANSFWRPLCTYKQPVN
jgi:hypothetical protein